MSKRNDPRFANQADVKAVKIGKYFGLSGIGYMSAGSWSDPILDTGISATFYELWCKVSGVTGRAYGHRISVQVSGVSSRTSQAIRAECEWQQASGHTAAGGAAVHAAAELASGNTGVSGIMSGLSGTFTIASETRNVQGTYAALSLQSEIKANNTMPTSTSFIRMADAGAEICFFLFATEGIASDGNGTSGAWETTADAHSGTVLGYYRVHTVAGTGYIAVYADHA